jgi:transcriptional regulator with XRE-family HTH domain
MGPTGSLRPTVNADAGSPRLDSEVTGDGRAGAAREATLRRAGPVPMRPRGGFGAYLHDLRLLRGMTIRGLATVAGLHHTYVSKLERGDRSAPDPRVVESLAAALAATPSQLDQLRWRAGHGVGSPEGRRDATSAEDGSPVAVTGTPAETAPSPVQVPVETIGDRPETVGPVAGMASSFGVGGGPVPAFANSTTSWQGTAAAQGGPVSTPTDPLRDPALTLLADALARVSDDGGRDALRRSVAAAVAGVQALPPGHPGLAGASAPVRWPSASSPVSRAAPREGAPLPIPHAPLPTGAAAHVANVERFAGGILTLDVAAAEIHVTPDYLWHLVQGGHLAAWVLPGTPIGSTVGVRVRREDVLGLLHPLGFKPSR